MQRRLFLATAAGAFIASAGPAAAHAMLSRAQPPVGGVVNAPVALLRLRFSERVEPALCRVVIINASGASIVTGALTTEGDGRVLVAPVSPLAPGAYHVRWHVVSVDTHMTEGDYSFRVVP